MRLDHKTGLPQIIRRTLVASNGAAITAATKVVPFVGPLKLNVNA